MKHPKVDLSFLSDDSVAVAEQLIGWRLYKLEDGKRIGGTIVETEAYNQTDAASHSYRGETLRTQVMFGPAGRVYVYFTYGMHYCMNIVTGQTGEGSAVLVRAIAADAGLATIKARRPHRPDHELTNGPAKVCQALHVTRDDNGKALNNSELLLLPPTKPLHSTATTRIGITKDTHRLWRFIAARTLLLTCIDCGQSPDQSAVSGVA